MKCVMNKLNLIDLDDVTIQELENFNPNTTFACDANDINTMVLYAMFSCVDNLEEFNNHTFSNFLSYKRQIAESKVECVKYELVQMGREKPMFSEFEGLQNNTAEECDEFLSDNFYCKTQWDNGYQGCHKLYEVHSKEYTLKFTLFFNEEFSDDIYLEELKKYSNETNQINDDFVNCLMVKLI